MRYLLTEKISNKNWEFRIHSERQMNGLFGMPLQCVTIDRIAFSELSEEKQIKCTAIIVGIAEKYPHEKFRIAYSNKSGFIVFLQKSGVKSIRYNDYEFKEKTNTLKWIGVKERLLYVKFKNNQ